MTIALGAGGGERGGGGWRERHNLVSFTPIYMDTLGQWESFPFEDKARGEKAPPAELQCDGTRWLGVGGGKVCTNLSVDFAGSLVCNSHLQMEVPSSGMFDMEIAWLWYSVCSALLSDLYCWLT